MESPGDLPVGHGLHSLVPTKSVLPEEEQELRAKFVDAASVFVDLGNGLHDGREINLLPSREMGDGNRCEEGAKFGGEGFIKGRDVLLLVILVCVEERAIGVRASFCSVLYPFV